jgi:hypothetical protein
MDLLTLVTARTLTVEPNVMHALIWEQSGGEPWSFSIQGQGWPRVFPTMQDAIREAQTSLPSRGRVRVGLAGLSSDARRLDGSATEAAPVAPSRSSRRRWPQQKRPMDWHVGQGGRRVAPGALPSFESEGSSNRIGGGRAANWIWMKRA